MKIRYCEKWSLFYKETHKDISKEEACKRHSERKSYTAVIIENDTEKYIVNVAGVWVSVYFLDENKRNYLYYSFKEVEKNKLSLIESSYWEYEVGSDKVLGTMHFTFLQDGSTMMSEKNEITGQIVQKEGNFSVQGNWDVYPEFGIYNSICKEQRE
ncbi:hypothetical protein [Clostridium scatologenes]|uniref:Uncharacterized protein n=1 Tax=Clostridium scatologenes TaxID=1548 RepID=A0A0E3K249_CLOSL|nr:hypothetical protein [Clostridium scatologenes]AKA70508.1 hypothetical protein CSCA_3383 [Clostridium scatologenes]